MPTIYPVNGRATPVAPGKVIEYEVPDMYGRPWAQIWEKYCEQGMQRPEGRGHLQLRLNDRNASRSRRRVIMRLVQSLQIPS